jgi:hypothetical protein
MHPPIPSCLVRLGSWSCLVSAMIDMLRAPAACSSGTAYDSDYEIEHTHPVLQPEGWIKHRKGHACYDPAKVRRRSSLRPLSAH